MPTENVLLAFGLTLFAGLATGIGSALAFFSKRTNKSFLAVSLGFSAGVMIYVSMIEIFIKAKDSLSAALGPTKGYWYTTIAFFAGMFLIALIDKFVPDLKTRMKRILLTNSKERTPSHKQQRTPPMGFSRLWRSQFTTFPKDWLRLQCFERPTMGVSIAVAIAIHNIPEGIAVSVQFTIQPVAGKRLLVILFYLESLSQLVR